MKVKKEDQHKLPKKTLPKKESKEAMTFGRVLRAIIHFIEMFFRYLLRFALGILTFIEKLVKAIGLLIIAVPLALILIAGSIYLLNSAFNLQNSPAFQKAREQLGYIYSLHFSKSLDDWKNETDSQDYFHLQEASKSESKIIQQDKASEVEQSNTSASNIAEKDVDATVLKRELQDIKSQLEAIQEVLEEVQKSA